MAKPVIAIGVPCYREVAPEILEDWMRFAYHLGRRMPEYDFFLAIKTKSEQFRARNAIVQAAQQVNADWLLMLDDDMVINPDATIGVSEAYGVLEKMIAHGKDLCGALYYQRGGHCSAVLMTKTGEKGYRFLRDDELDGGLQRVDVAGGGCLLVNMRVFDKIAQPYFAPEHEFGTDIQLCRKAVEAGFEVWADTSIELGHLKNERTIVTSRNRHQFQITDTLPGDVKQTFIGSDVFERVEADAKTWTGYDSIATMADVAFEFMSKRKETAVSDPEWYRLYPKERVARQVWFNNTPAKRQMTEFILASVSHEKPLRILDFGCGIGIPAFTLAEKGHQVTACDIAETGTLEFLKWRVKQHGLPMTFHESGGGLPHLGGALFDVIIAMDSIEHVKDWERLVGYLSSRLVPGGVLFANNAILEDASHPEHYLWEPKKFLKACAEADLQPLNQITYVKRAAVGTAPSQEMAHAS
jgi:2-polyprenyl-3-methyl-5-hydroxy-6-metoxy-1,4-benzoquinol methylase